ETCGKSGVTEEEVRRAKDFLIGKTTLSLEDSEERAHFYGKQQLLYPKTRTIDEYFAEIEKVKRDQVNDLAKRLLKMEELRLVVVGKEDNQQKLQHLLS